MPGRLARVLPVALLALLGACDYPTGPSNVDFATQSALARLTLSRGSTTLVATHGSGEFHVTSPVAAEHRLTFRLEFPPVAPVSHQVFVNVTEDVSLHSERLGARRDFLHYDTGRGASGDDYDLSFVSGRTPGRHSIRVTVEESEGDRPGLALVAEVIIHLTLERPPSDVQSDLLYLDLAAGGEPGDAGSETLLVTSESGAFEVTSTVDTPHTLGYSVFLAPLAPVRRAVTITLTEDYSLAAARRYHLGSYVSVHHTGRRGSGRLSGGLTGPHFHTRSTPGVYHARLRIEESGPGLPPDQTLVDEVTIRLTLTPK